MQRRHGDDMDMESTMSMGSSMAATMPESMADSMSTMSSRMPSSQMSMVFFSDTTTSLYSAMWTPRTTGQYAGTCIFLITLAFLYRGSFTLKAFVNKKLADHAERGRQPDTLGIEESISGSKEAVLVTASGSEERVSVLRSEVRMARPWHFAVDLPQSVLALVSVAMGYLLMLAVMTMNVGFFASVLGGAFLGELVFGRFIR